MFMPISLVCTPLSEEATEQWFQLSDLIQNLQILSMTDDHWSYIWGTPSSPPNWLTSSFRVPAQLILSSNGYGKLVAGVNINSFAGCYFVTDLIPEMSSEEREESSMISAVFSVLIIKMKPYNISSLIALSISGSGAFWAFLGLILIHILTK
jgi:hypothetical protein